MISFKHYIEPPRNLYAVGGNSKRCSHAFLREKRVEGTKNPVSIIRAKKNPEK